MHGVDLLASILQSTSVPPEVLASDVFDRLSRFGREVVERLGVHGQDADALVAGVLADLRTGPLDPSGTVTLHAALRHRLHLAALHHWRAQRRRAAATARSAAEPAARPERDGDPSRRLVLEEDRARVRAALVRLPPTDATLLRLLYLTSMPVEQVRAQMGYRSLDVLYVRSSRARARLREILDGEVPQ